MAVEKSIDQQIQEEVASKPQIMNGADVDAPEDEVVVSEEAIVIEMDDGGVEVDFDPESTEGMSGAKFGENIAEILDEEVLQGIASDLIAQYEEDKASREDWVTTYTDGLDLLGIKSEDRTTPFEGACGVTHPILSCLLYTSPSPRDPKTTRMPSSA